MHIVRARADIVATKLGVILSFFLPSSMHILFSHNGFTYDFEFLHANNKKFSNKKNWEGGPLHPLTIVISGWTEGISPRRGLPTI